MFVRSILGNCVAMLSSFWPILGPSWASNISSSSSSSSRSSSSSGSSSSSSNSSSSSTSGSSNINRW